VCSHTTSNQLGDYSISLKWPSSDLDHSLMTSYHSEKLTKFASSHYFSQLTNE